MWRGLSRYRMSVGTVMCKAWANMGNVLTLIVEPVPISGRYCVKHGPIQTTFCLHDNKKIEAIPLENWAKIIQISNIGKNCINCGTIGKCGLTLTTMFWTVTKSQYQIRNNFVKMWLISSKHRISRICEKRGLT